MKREEIIKLYESYLKMMSSENTVRSYLFTVNDFFEKNNICIEEVIPMQVEYYVNNLDCSYKTKQLRLTALKSFFSFCYNNRIIKFNPTERIGKIKKTKDDAKVQEKKNDNKETISELLSQEKQAELLLACKNPRDKAIILTFLKLGLRVSELINITLEDYQKAKENDGRLDIVGKGTKYRFVFITDELFSVIDDYLAVRKESSDNNLFISNRGNKMDSSCIGRTIKTLGKRAGFTEEEISVLHTHLLRDCFTTNSLDKGVNVALVSLWLGHASVNTTLAHYAKQTVSNMKQIAQ